MEMMRQDTMSRQKGNTQNLQGIRIILAKEIRLIAMMEVRQNKNLTNNQSLQNPENTLKIRLIKTTAPKKIREIQVVKEMQVDLGIDEILK